VASRHLPQFRPFAINHQPSAINRNQLHCALEIGNIGNIVVHQQLNRQQTGNRLATSATSLSISNLASPFLLSTINHQPNRIAR